VSNKIYQKIVSHNIQNFLSRYYSVSEWFSTELKDNRHFHEGEFGYAREEAVRILLKKFISNRFECSNGFVLNGSDQQTTQCDAVIYDAQESPLRDTESAIKFFPCESVVAIGEVKSKLTKTSLKNALIKLAENKKIRNSMIGDAKTLRPRKRFDPIGNPFDAIFTFLVCESVDSFDANTADWIEKKYDENNIPHYLRHNFVLSINDGFLSYCRFDLSDASKIFPGTFYYPIYPTAAENPKHKTEKHSCCESNVQEFLTCISNALQNADVAYPEPTNYL